MAIHATVRFGSDYSKLIIPQFYLKAFLLGTPFFIIELNRFFYPKIFFIGLPVEKSGRLIPELSAGLWSGTPKA